MHHQTNVKKNVLETRCSGISQIELHEAKGGGNPHSRSHYHRNRVSAAFQPEAVCLKVAVRYNGAPRGVPNCNEGGCKRCNEGGPSAIDGFEECLCIHAEENALLEAGRERVGKGAVLYCNT